MSGILQRKIKDWIRYKYASNLADLKAIIIFSNAFDLCIFDFEVFCSDANNNEPSSK